MHRRPDRIHQGLRGLISAGMIFALALDAPSALASSPDEPQEPAGQESSEPGNRAPEGSAAQALGLLEETQERIDEVIALDRSVAKASGEEQAVLVEQQNARAGEAGALLRQLLTTLTEEPESQDGIARGRMAGFLNEASQWNLEQLKKITLALQGLNKQRDEADEAKLPAIRERIVRAHERYDNLLQTSLEIAEAKVRLGLPTDADYKTIDAALQQRSEERAGQLRISRRRIAEYEKQAAASPEEASKLQPMIAQEKSILDSRVESVRRLADMLQSRGLPSASYRQLVIETTGKISVDILDREVATGLIQDWWNDLKSWAARAAPVVAFNLFFALLILLLSHVTGRFSQRLVRRALERAHSPVSNLFQAFLLTATYRVTLGLGILIALAQIGLQIGPLLAGLGVASFIVGFALQDSLSNFASGMLILAYRPFDVGDVVNAGGVTGRVEAMTLVTTTVLTFDNQRLIVPNRKIWGDVITNVTAEQVRRVDLTFGISYADDIEHTERVLKEIVNQHPKVLETPEPVVRLHELGESSVNFIVRPWANTTDYWEVYWDLTREVKRRFDAEGISIPFPQRDIHVRQDTEPSA